MVQLATYSLVNMDMPQGSNNKSENMIRDEFMLFDFGRNRESLI